MEINWLKDFIVLSKEGNFRIAATRRGVSQPAFSRRIRALETWIDAPLIDRNSRPSQLTEAGRLFLPVAKKIVDLADSGKREIKDRAKEENEKIRLATLGTLSQIFIPEWLKRLEPFIYASQFVIKTEFRTTDDYFMALKENEVDFFVTYLAPDMESLERKRYDNEPIFIGRTLGTDTLIPVVSPNRDGSPRWWLPDRLNEQIPCLHTLSDNSPWPIKAHMKKKYGGLKFRSVYESSISTTLRGMAIQGFGLAWLPGMLVKDDLACGRLVRAAESADDLPVEIRIYRCIKSSAPRVEKFWRALLEQTSEPSPDRH